MYGAKLLDTFDLLYCVLYKNFEFACILNSEIEYILYYNIYPVLS